MNFIDLVRACAPKSIATAVAWWEQLCNEASAAAGKAAHNLRLNIEGTNLFGTHPLHAAHLREFCDALEGTTGDSIKRATAAIARTGKMVCAGPTSRELPGGACALIRFDSFLNRYMESARGPAAVDDDSIWEDLDSPSVYASCVSRSKDYKNQLPCRFWASCDDIVGLEAKGAVRGSRLRQFLGIGDWEEKAILIRVQDGRTPPATIPTGWDGFDNGYFTENAGYDASDTNTHFGYTLDLATKTAGAREAVTAPVPCRDTRLLRRCPWRPRRRYSRRC